MQQDKDATEEHFDRKIQMAIDKAQAIQTLAVKDSLGSMKLRIDNLFEPVKTQLLDMKSESEGFARQNIKFMKLYRECLTYLHAEVREKKKVLDAAHLAYLTTDPGQV